MTQFKDWADFTRGCFACCIGAWLSGASWLIARNPWVGVFAVGFCLGLFMLENWRLLEEAQSLQDNRTDLEKQIIALRSTICKMSQNQNYAVDGAPSVKKKRDGFKENVKLRSRSLSSL